MGRRKTAPQLVAVIGGGAGGLCAAIAAGRAGADVVIFEQANRVGKELLKTGNGRCNLSNMEVTPDDYNHPDFVEPTLREYFCEELLDFFMHHPFWDRPVPRSGWVGDYNEQYIDSVLDKFGHLPAEDILATSCAFTGAAVAKSMIDNIPAEIIEKTDKLYTSGGGVKNPQIMKEIRERIPGNIKVTTSAEIGIPPEYKEAIKFATIAYSTIHRIPGNIPAAGHASQYSILGKIALAPRNIAGGPQI